MNKVAVRSEKRAVRRVDRSAAEVVEPASTASPYFSFRHSYMEISSRAGKTHVKSRKTQLVDGKLTAETFEGEMDRSAYEQIVTQIQHHFLSQTALFLKSVSLFLPLFREKRSDGE